MVEIALLLILGTLAGTTVYYMIQEQKRLKEESLVYKETRESMADSLERIACSMENKI